MSPEVDLHASSILLNISMNVLPLSQIQTGLILMALLLFLLPEFSTAHSFRLRTLESSVTNIKAQSYLVNTESSGFL